MTEGLDKYEMVLSDISRTAMQEEMKGWGCMSNDGNGSIFKVRWVISCEEVYTIVPAAFCIVSMTLSSSTHIDALGDDSWIIFKAEKINTMIK